MINLIKALLIIMIIFCMLAFFAIPWEYMNRVKEQDVVIIEENTRIDLIDPVAQKEFNELIQKLYYE